MDGTHIINDEFDHIPLTEISGEDYKKEALLRAAKERSEIVSKYNKGEDSENEFEDWEDASAKVYKVTDRYGFLHEEELSEITLEEDRRKQIEVKRQLKWLKMVNKWKAYQGSDKLRQRVFKGIPLNLRGDAWRLMLEVAVLMDANPTVYTEMKERSHQQSPDIKQIDMDVNRTYRDHIMFRARYSIKQQQLFHVLAAYSMYNTEVGYCQGMSQIAALLLMYMSEEEAFWALHSLLYGEKHRMHGFFIPGFPKLMRFQDHHDKILKKQIPRLKKHLDKQEIFASLYSLKWFFQCFLDRTPFPLTLRLWDIYVLEGERVLTAMSYCTLKMHKALIKKMEMDEIVAFLQEKLSRNFGAEDDIVIENLKGCLVELKRSGLLVAPPPGPDEAPKLPFGARAQPTFEQETGLRSPGQKKPQDENAPKKDKKDTKKSKNAKVKKSKSKASSTNGRDTLTPSSGGEVTSATDSKGRTSADENGKNSTERRDKTSRRSGRRSEDRGAVNSSGSSTGKDKKKSTRDSKRSSDKKNKLKNSVSNGETVADNTNRNSPVHSDGEKYELSTENRLSPNTSPQKSGSRNSGHENESIRTSDSGRDDKSFRPLWKTPSPSKVLPSKGDRVPEHDNNSPASNTNGNHGKSPNSFGKWNVISQSNQGSARNERNELSSSEPRYSDTDSYSYSTSPADDRNSRTRPQTSAIQTKYFPLRSAADNRPLSVYDNVTSTFTESEDDLTNDVTYNYNDVTLPHRIATSDEGDTSHFENRMEESLETLENLSEARLNNSPSPFPISSKQKAISVRRTPSMDYKTFSSLLSIGDNKAHYYARSKSWDMTEDLHSPFPEPARSPPGSKSMDALQDFSGSQFRKVVEGSGITTLPKPPSAFELNALLSEASKNSNSNNAGYSTRTSENWGVNNEISSNDFRPNRGTGKWQDSYLNHEERRDMEYTPVRTNYINQDHNVASYRVPLKHGYNDHSVFPNNYARQAEISPRRRSSMGYFSYHSSHSQELLNVQRFDDDVVTRSFLPSSLSYSDGLSSPKHYDRSTRSTQHNHNNRFPIRHREIGVDPPSYTASNYRQNRHNFSGSRSSGIDTYRSKEHRKSNVSIAIQTEHPVTLR